MEDSKLSQFQQVVQLIDPHATLLNTWPLQGGVSAQVTGLEIERHGAGKAKLIVRQHGAADLQSNPHIAADEFRLLHLLHSYGLAAPMPYLFDESGAIFPTPYLVVEYVEGTPDDTPAHVPDCTLQLATHLSKIHAIDSSKVDLSFLPQQELRYATLLRERPTRSDQFFDEARIRAALQAAWPLPKRNRPVLLHGDFWPGNSLWKHGQLVAIIDWEDAAVGDPLADLGNSRLEILWAYGSDAMYNFTQQYYACTPIDVTGLPYWDLCAVLRSAPKIADWGLDHHAEQNMRERLRWFITQAFAELA